MSYCNRCGAPHQGRCLRPDDALRDRIAYAIAQADGDLPGMEPYSWDYVLADAVIRELDSRGWLIDPESEDRRRHARNKRWLEGDDE